MFGAGGPAVDPKLTVNAAIASPESTLNMRRTEERPTSATCTIRLRPPGDHPPRRSPCHTRTWASRRFQELGLHRFPQRTWRGFNAVGAADDLAGNSPCSL